ncbi:hypothetical protein FRB95_004106 [Tulasnella sp. JGI-2019a]|nr:hypothetical protein FRB95_004106 [Tulasnella sp. JGI-2019a]
MWNVAYLFLKRWHSTVVDPVSLDVEKAPAMTDAAIKSLASYAQKELSAIHHDMTNVEMFVLIADFVQQASYCDQ